MFFTGAYNKVIIILTPKIDSKQDTIIPLLVKAPFDFRVQEYQGRQRRGVRVC